MPKQDPPKEKKSRIYTNKTEFDKAQQAYNDSLYAYNYSKNDVDILKNTLNYNDWINYVNNYGNEKLKKSLNNLELLNKKRPEYQYHYTKAFSDTEEGDAGSYVRPVQPVEYKSLPSYQQIPTKTPNLQSRQIEEKPLQITPVKNAIIYPKDVQRYSAGQYLESQGKQSGYVNYGEGQGRKPLYDDGGLLNNNGMINEYKGDSHFDPSGGIELNNAIVEDGELEYKGYVFSKDSEENRQLRKEMRLRKLRTDDDDYIPDAISRRSLNRAAIPLVESHEKKRMNRLMADLEKAEKQMDEAGIPTQGDMPLDLSLDPSMMNDPSMGLPMMAEGGFVPKITTNQQYDQSFIDPSNMNDASTASFSPAGTKSRGSDAAKAANYIGTAANVASSFLPENPYPDKGKEVGAMNAAGDAIAGAIVPFYNETNQIAELGTGLRNQGIQDDNEALEITGSTIEGLDQFGSRMKSIDMADKGIITGEENAAIQIIDTFVPFLGNNILNAKEKEYYEELAVRNELQGKLDNRDYGGTDMEAQGERNRYLKYGGKRVMSGGGKRYMNDGGDMRPNRTDFDFGEAILQYDPSSPDAVYPLLPEKDQNTYYTGSNVFSMVDDIDSENQQDDFSKAQMAKAISENPSILSAYDKSRELSSYPSKPILSVSGSAQGPNTPMSKKWQRNLPLDNADWANIGESVGMGLLGNIGNLAYLFDEGKDYDKVSYGRYNPDLMNASSSRRAVRDSMATSKEALKESGRLDRNSLALLGTQSAQQLADAEERVRLTNTGMLNDAQLKNLEVGMKEQDDTARNKGAALTNYYNALSALGQNAQAAGRGYNLRISDAEKQRLVAENNAYLRELIAKMG